MPRRKLLPKLDPDALDEIRNRLLDLAEDLTRPFIDGAQLARDLDSAITDVLQDRMDEFEETGIDDAEESSGSS